MGDDFSQGFIERIQVHQKSFSLDIGQLEFVDADAIKKFLHRPNAQSRQNAPTKSLNDETHRHDVCARGNTLRSNDSTQAQDSFSFDYVLAQFVEANEW